MTIFNGLVGIVWNLVFVALYISFSAAGPFDPLLFTSGWIPSAEQELALVWMYSNDRQIETAPMI
jgi:hypothetical protein